jgi:hypothetical protein
MYINKNLIDSVSLDRNKIIYPGYISGYTRLLKDKHNNLIGTAKDEPEFIVREKCQGQSKAN